MGIKYQGMNVDYLEGLGSGEGVGDVWGICYDYFLVDLTFSPMKTFLYWFYKLVSILFFELFC